MLALQSHERERHDRGRAEYRDTLAELPLAYYADGDLTAFVDAASPWVVAYAARRLHRDPDVLGDFYLRFLERAGDCLEAYRERRHIPFTGFLAAYLRHDFLNFIRARRTTEIRTERLHSEMLPQAHAQVEVEDPAGMTAPTATRALAELDPELRLPLKLNFGVDLNIQDLRYMMERVGDPHRAAAFLHGYEVRRRERQANVRKWSDRAARLTFMLEKGGRQNPARPGQEPRRRLLAWKERVLALLSRKGRVMTRVEVAQLLNVNKSTITRRIDRAVGKLKGESQWNPTQVSTASSSPALGL